MKLDTKSTLVLEWPLCLRNRGLSDGGGDEMYINVSGLTRESSGSTRTYEIDEDCDLLDGSGPRRLTGTVNLLRTDKGVWVSASLDTHTDSICGRCLAEYVQPLHMAIEEEFLFEIDPFTGTRTSRSEDDQYFHIGPDQLLDLTESAIQYAALNMPMKPICRKECAGMCLDCGADLNESACSCESSPIDERWAALSMLLLGVGEEQ